MFKHIIGQAIYQLIILLIIMLAGETFIPEYEDSFDDEIRNKNLTLTVKYNFIDGEKYIRSGRKIFIDDPTRKDYEDLEKAYFLK